MHIYRFPHPFHNEVVVVVVRNSVSGRDISMELVGVAKEIHLSVKSLDISEGLSKVISKHHNLHLHLQVPLYHLPAPNFRHEYMVLNRKTKGKWQERKTKA
ncbi:Flavin-containing monooxygenase FMO GS-OX-like 9 [Vitis vinifera]|uniref:Flavin-containing monooxygenase FMO GS-OX-like 9 n=1 Tax=Vitis vinifera TaxID=29760 RepID=A0A438HG05_VITVI|nr:Flavin-containing monooxygenase FMO GS-OX-like 9 [Vitis vinifera]